MEKTPFFSVIMPVRLTDYAGAANDREKKFIDAVRSFAFQIHTKCHLYIISDNDSAVKDVLLRHDFKKVTLIEHTGEWELHKGLLRQIGIEEARKMDKLKLPHYITYLDSDDLFNAHHLSDLADKIQKTNFKKFYVCSNVIGRPPFIETIEIRIPKVSTYGGVGTSNLIHTINTEASWEGLNGYGHDFEFTKKLIKEFGMPVYTNTNGYYVGR